MKNKVFNVLGEFAAIAGVMLVFRMFTESRLTVDISLDFFMLVMAVTIGSIFGKMIAEKMKLFKKEGINNMFFNGVLVAICAAIAVSVDASVAERTIFVVNGIIACIGALVLGIGCNLLAAEK